MSLEFRKKIYVDFAHDANQSQTRWIVLHGMEGYPEGMGRDLDIAFKTEADLKKLLTTFETCVRRHGVRWVVHPSPLWGRRVLGITSGYDVVELHTIPKVCWFNVNMVPDWQNVELSEGVFPVESTMAFFKTCMLPALVADKKWRCKCEEAKAPENVPWWLARAAKNVKNGIALSTAAKVSLLGGFLVSRPLASLVNLGTWIKRKRQVYLQPTVPIYRIPPALDKTAFETLMRDRLGELFLEFVCADHLPLRKIQKIQAGQNMLFVSPADKRKLNAVELTRGPSEQEDLLLDVVEAFVRFSKRWEG
jgi:hypothetical protein